MRQPLVARPLGKNGLAVPGQHGREQSGEIGIELLEESYEPTVLYRMEDKTADFTTYQVSFPNILDNTSSGPNTTLYNLRNFPTLYLIDPKGVILLKNASLDAMVARIEADLAK